MQEGHFTAIVIEVADCTLSQSFDTYDNEIQNQTNTLAYDLMYQNDSVKALNSDNTKKKEAKTSTRSAPTYTYP